MLEFVSGAVLLILSGLSWIAYKHPEGYFRLYVRLVVGLCILGLGMTVWELALSASFTGLIPFIMEDKRAQAREVRNSLSLPVWTWLMLAIILVYSIFLVELEKFTKKHGEETD